VQKQVLHNYIVCFAAKMVLAYINWLLNVIFPKEVKNLYLNDLSSYFGF
jgi:hypothetical protein